MQYTMNLIPRPRCPCAMYPALAVPFPSLPFVILVALMPKINDWYFDMVRLSALNLWYTRLIWAWYSWPNIKTNMNFEPRGSFFNNGEVSNPPMQTEDLDPQQSHFDNRNMDDSTIFIRTSQASSVFSPFRNEVSLNLLSFSPHEILIPFQMTIGRLKLLYWKRSLIWR